MHTVIITNIKRICPSRKILLSVATQQYWTQTDFLPFSIERCTLPLNAWEHQTIFVKKTQKRTCTDCSLAGDIERDQFVLKDISNSVFKSRNGMQHKTNCNFASRHSCDIYQENAHAPFSFLACCWANIWASFVLPMISTSIFSSNASFCPNNWVYAM